jgi:hypothetical protein
MSQLTRKATKALEILSALTKVVGIDSQVYIQTSYREIEREREIERLNY